MKGSELKRIRRSNGLTQTELAKMIGVTKGTIINYEGGGVIPESKLPLLEKALESLKKEDPNNTKDVFAGLDKYNIKDVSTYVVSRQDDFLNDPLFNEFVEKMALRRMLEMMQRTK